MQSLTCYIFFFDSDMLHMLSFRYIYHHLLGHEVESQIVRNALPRRFGAPGLPELNASQVGQIRNAVQSFGIF